MNEYIEQSLWNICVTQTFLCAEVFNHACNTLSNTHINIFLRETEKNSPDFIRYPAFHKSFRISQVIPNTIIIIIIFIIIEGANNKLSSSTTSRKWHLRQVIKTHNFHSIPWPRTEYVLTCIK